MTTQGNVCLGKVLVWDERESTATTSPSLKFCLEKRRLLERTEPELGARTYKERHFTSREESYLVATANYWAVWMSRGLTAWGGGWGPLSSLFLAPRIQCDSEQMFC